MSLERALRRLYELEPRGLDLGLERVEQAAALLGNPERCFLSVQVAGTNGKGTVATLFAHAATLSGLRVGLFTSPHLHRFSERIKIGGVEAKDEFLARQLDRVLDLNHRHPELDLTFFEVATLTALTSFRDAYVDLAVLEVGLGGRLDATSIAAPVLTAITSIGLDHTAILGETHGEIAFEKASIARSGVPLIVGALPYEAQSVVEEVASTVGAPLRILGRDFNPSNEWAPPWPGSYQVNNTVIAFEMFESLRGRDERLSRPAFVEALKTVSWPGRYEWLGTRPRYLLDCAHNLEATRALAASIALMEITLDTLIFGVLRDKPAIEMLNFLRPIARHVILVPPPIDRALDPASIAQHGDTVCRSVRQALFVAEESTGDNGAVLVTGSVFTVGAARGLILDEPSDPPIGL